MIELDGRPPTVEELAAVALSGYGCFTTMLVERGRVRGLPLHLHRLAGDARQLFEADLDPERVRALAARAGDGPVVVRVGVVDPGLDPARPGRTGHPGILVSTRPAPDGEPEPVRLRTVRYARELAPVKHAGLLGALHQRALAQRAGADDALFVDAAGRVAEAPTANLVLLDGRAGGGSLVFPVGDGLPGVTEALLRQVAADAGLSTVEAEVPVGELGRYPGALLCNATVGVRPVAAIDGHPVAPDPAVYGALRRAYQRIEGDPLAP